MRKVNFSILLIGISLFAIASCVQGPPEGSRAAQAQRGKVHFQQYCSGCHGPDGRGLYIDTVATQPADLTRILASRKTGEFPVLEIVRMIDGRKLVAAHGTRTMPAWGEVFSTEEHLDETQIKGKMGELIAYLMTIQGT